MSSANPQGLQAFPEALTAREAWLEPSDWYREMREHAPVRYDSTRESWDVFRYDDVKRILDDDETFSANPRNATDFQEPEGMGQGLIFDTMLFRIRLVTMNSEESLTRRSSRGLSATLSPVSVN